MLLHPGQEEPLGLPPPTPTMETWTGERMDWGLRTRGSTLMGNCELPLRVSKWILGQN